MPWVERWPVKVRELLHVGERTLPNRLGVYEHLDWEEEQYEEPWELLQPYMKHTYTQKLS